MSCDVGSRCGLDLVLLWLWCRQAATIPTGPLAWEPPYAMSVALGSTRRQKTNKQTNKKNKERKEYIKMFTERSAGRLLQEKLGQGNEEEKGVQILQKRRPASGTEG